MFASTIQGYGESNKATKAGIKSLEGQEANALGFFGAIWEVRRLIPFKQEMLIFGAIGTIIGAGIINFSPLVMDKTADIVNNSSIVAGIRVGSEVKERTNALKSGDLAAFKRAIIATKSNNEQVASLD